VFSVHASVQSGLRGSGTDDLLEKTIMTLSIHRNRLPATLLFAFAPALSLLPDSALAQARDERSLPSVIVTSSRFASNPSDNPIGATVITADQIREAGINNVNEAVRKIAGVRGRRNFSGTQDYSLDMRGFGANSDQNLVVLVDGVRISENELSPALLSSVPIELVERVEIIRGGSSVLYGEGATGGVINVITRRAALNSQRGTVVGEAGSWNTREGRASVSKGWDAIALDANIGTLHTDNYRDNNAVKQNNFSGGVQWASRDARAGLRIDALRQDARFPGALTLEQFQANPRQTSSPNDFGNIDANRYTLFGERRMGAFELAAELAHRDKTSRGSFASAFGVFDSNADTHMTQFSPRLRHLSGTGPWNNEFVAGMDFTRWTRFTNSDSGGFPVSRADASQKSRAFYVRDEVRTGKVRVALGGRTETFDQSSIDPVPFSTNNYDTSQRLNAWDLQGSYAIATGIDLFGKAGRSYRVANVDENALTPVPNQPLAPQTSRDLEVGTTVGSAERKVTARLFQHRLRNEIFFDPTVAGFGANSNLDPTERKGVEVEASARLAAAWTMLATLQHVSAKFTEGPNAGKEMVLVPRNTATARLNWLPGNGHTADVGVQWVGEQRYGGDFTNTCASRIPSYTTLDARYAFRFRNWELAVIGNNLTDRHYFSNAFGTCNSGIYPDPGRQLKVSARYDF
jgi:iron complex outermembrane recepter protein